MNWTRTKTLAVVLFVSLALNLFLAGSMVGRWSGHGRHAWGENKHWGAKYWLSHTLGDEAAPKVEAMWDTHRAKLKPLREEAKQARGAIQQALAADPFDAEAYAAALQHSLERGMAVRASHHAFMIDLARVLTPEQRAKLAEHAGRKRWRHRRE